MPSIRPASACRRDVGLRRSPSVGAGRGHRRRAARHGRGGQPRSRRREPGLQRAAAAVAPAPARRRVRRDRERRVRCNGWSTCARSATSRCSSRCTRSRSPSRRGPRSSPPRSSRSGSCSRRCAGASSEPVEGLDRAHRPGHRGRRARHQHPQPSRARLASLHERAAQLGVRARPAGPARRRGRARADRARDARHRRPQSLGDDRARRRRQLRGSQTLPSERAGRDDDRVAHRPPGADRDAAAARRAARREPTRRARARSRAMAQLDALVDAGARGRPRGRATRYPASPRDARAPASSSPLTGSSRKRSRTRSSTPAMAPRRAVELRCAATARSTSRCATPGADRSRVPAIRRAAACAACASAPRSTAALSRPGPQPERRLAGRGYADRRSASRRSGAR